MGLNFESRFIRLLVYILCLHSAAIFFFTRGFLLTRNELPVFSNCDDVSATDCSGIPLSDNARKLTDFDHNLRTCDRSSENDKRQHCEPRELAEENESYKSAQIYVENPIDSAPASAVRSGVFPQGRNEAYGDCCGKVDHAKIEERPRNKTNFESQLEDVTERDRGRCWTAPAIKRVVILILDALRFDFVAPSRLFTDKPQPWMDRLQVMQQLILEEKPAALLFKFTADPPTTSLQRLKGLMTGSLPTFIDVGNSFGAPAIVEDNLIHQLANNGKRVLMMGDDTWVQLFPTQFAEAHPFPSFNVKDLHTVDDGVIDNLFPALYKDNWDVLIGHFLGVDHVGHIFGVESTQMVEKLEQYNRVVENAISIIRNQSYPGGLHEDTLLLVMGDHGQTLNGDHGGGTREEVETALFAMSARQPVCPVPRRLQSACTFSLEAERVACIHTFPQLDFAATVAALVGVPFPFGSIGRVNPELFGLVAGTWLTSTCESVDLHKHDCLETKWMEHYHHVLCMNSWQVNRYFELYAESSLHGFASPDLYNIHNLYNKAQSFVVNQLQHRVASSETEHILNERMSILTEGIDAHSKYLEAAAALARSKWTHFGIGIMIFGLMIFFSSFAVHAAALYTVSSCGHVEAHPDLEDCKKILPIKDMLSGGFFYSVCVTIVSAFLSMLSLLLRGSSPLSNHLGLLMAGGFILGSVKSCLFSENSTTEHPLIVTRGVVLTEEWRLDPRGILAIFSVVIYACSLLSNSYILKEGQVVNFLLASSGVLDLRHALQNKFKVPQALLYLGLNFILGQFSSMNVFKDTEVITEALTVQGPLNIISPKRTLVMWQLLSTGISAFLPLVALAFFFIKSLQRSSLLRRSCSQAISVGLLITYILVYLHWLLDDLIKLQAVTFSEAVQAHARLHIPRLVYFLAVVLLMVLIYMVMSIRCKYGKVQLQEVIKETSVPCLAVLSSLVLLLLGRRGPLIALIAGIQGWLLIDMQYWPPGGAASRLDLILGDSVRPFQWSLFSVQLFFCTGHRCTFDGLRYAAAFVGFDQFNIYRQGILLTADTFGASHVLPVLGLPLLVNDMYPDVRNMPSTALYRLQIAQAFLLYGLFRLVATILTTVCVTIQRRHLMVWGLFAPKFVFDAIGLLITDMALLTASFYYLLPFSR